MALSWEESTATAGQTTVAVNIAYLDKSDIYVELNDVSVTGFTWSSDTLITLPNTVTVAAGDKIAVIRKTSRDALRLLFSEGAAFTRDNIDEQNEQFLYLAQELVEGRSIDGFYGDISMNSYRITDVGTPEESGDAANKAYVDAETKARQEGDAYIQAQLTNTTPLEGSVFSPISWHEQTIQGSIDIPANKNAWSFGPTMNIKEGVAVGIGEGSYWTIANGEVKE